MRFQTTADAVIPQNQISSRLASVLPNVLEGHEKCEPVPLSSHEISVQPTPEAEHQIVELELTPEPKSSDHTSEDSYDSYSCGSGRSTMAGHISKIVAAESHHECVTIEPLGISGPSDGRYGMSTMHTSPNHTYQIIIPPVSFGPCGYTQRLSSSTRTPRLSSTLTVIANGSVVAQIVRNLIMEWRNGYGR